MFHCCATVRISISQRGDTDAGFSLMVAKDRGCIGIVWSFLGLQGAVAPELDTSKQLVREIANGTGMPFPGS